MKRTLITLLLATVLAGCSTGAPSQKTETVKNGTERQSHTVQPDAEETAEATPATGTIDNIVMEQVGITKAGDLVIKVTNNNEVPVCIEGVEADFKDADGNFAYKEDSMNWYIGIPANSYTMTYLWGYDENFSQYPEVSFKAELTNIADNFVYSDVEITSNDTGSQIAVTCKNNSESTLDRVSVNVVYYLGDEIVGVESGSDSSTLTVGSEAYINVDYPRDSDYNDVAFDGFEVYLLQAGKAN